MFYIQKYLKQKLSHKHFQKTFLVICSAQNTRLQSIATLPHPFARPTSVHLEQVLNRLPYQNRKITDQDRASFAKIFLPVQ